MSDGGSARETNAEHTDAGLHSRSAGLLLHPTSLPGPHGIGDLGGAAFRFVDYLAAAQQQIWQVLPLGPTGFGDSPYAARSTFAGNPLLISLEVARDEGLLTEDDLSDSPAFDPDRVDFGAVAAFKLNRLRNASGRMLATGGAGWELPLADFCAENALWLDDFALYMALRETHQGAPWDQWGEAIRKREPSAIIAARQDLAEEIAFHQFLQF
ncbi:MAG TPA: 4-alpha-glucanotransferase, partial [Dehalococcoidia bacterium]